MFGRRKRQERITQVVADYMDQEVAESGSERLPDGGRSVVEVVEELMSLADNDVEGLMLALQSWYESRKASAESPDRADDVSGLYASIALSGLGNLFGFIPEGAPAFDPELADLGRDRGWRS